jgi:hypothetical protein
MYVTNKIPGQVIFLFTRKFESKFEKNNQPNIATMYSWQNVAMTTISGTPRQIVHNISCLNNHAPGAYKS